MSDFSQSPIHPIPALGDSHSQPNQTAQLVKDPGRELGEGVIVETPIDSPHTAKDPAT